MAADAPRSFETAIAYCLAYERQGGKPSPEAVKGFVELAQAALDPLKIDATETIYQLAPNATTPSGTVGRSQDRPGDGWRDENQAVRL